MFSYSTLSLVIGLIWSHLVVIETSKSDPSKPLFLTPLIKAGQIQRAQKLSAVKPFLNGVRSHSGYLTADKRYDSNLFFWYFLSEKNPVTAPLVVWLQGGPGSSCMFGVFVEHGPYEFDNDRLKKRQYSWTRYFNLLYIDNPVGTGFSFTNDSAGYSSDQTMIADNLYEVLKQFLQLFPYLRQTKIVLSGESYGGKYAPGLAHAILMRNERSEFKINLYGVFIGNPFFSPEGMLDHGEFLYAHGLVDSNGMKMMQEREHRIKVLIRARKWSEATDLFAKTFFEGTQPNRETLLKALTGLDQHFHALQETLGINQYYITFLRKKDTREALHVGNREYAVNTTVYYILQEDLMKSMTKEVGLVMENLRMAIYTGHLDLLCPYYLQENVIRKLEWNGSRSYHTVERQTITIDEHVAGYYKSAEKFTDIVIRNAGHLVAKDKPKWLLEILRMFVDGRLSNQ